MKPDLGTPALCAHGACCLFVCRPRIRACCLDVAGEYVVLSAVSCHPVCQLWFGRDVKGMVGYVGRSCASVASDCVGCPASAGPLCGRSRVVEAGQGWGSRPQRQKGPSRGNTP